jgi:peptide/nickel transport system substrate-binding protein
MRKHRRLLALVAAVFVLDAAAACVAVGYLGRKAKEPPTLTLAIIGEPAGLNPLILSDQRGADAARLFYEPLINVDGAGRPAPGLAVSWSSADGGRTWTVRLRPGVIWHDGRRFTADDVVFTYASLADTNFIFNPGGFWRGLGVAKLDDLTVRFTPAAPDSFLPWRLTLPVLPEGQLSGVPFDQWPTHPTVAKPVGTGPYVFEEWRPGQSLTARANPNYWGGPPAFGRVTLRFHEAAADRGFKRVGEIRSFRGSSYFFIAFNQKAGVGLFDDSRVRQALSVGLDRRKVLEAAGLAGVRGRRDAAYPLASPFPPGVWPNVADEGPSVAPDVGRAKALLAAAGWKDSDGDGLVDRAGHQLRFTLLAPEEPAPARPTTRIKAAQEVAAQWRKIGVAAEVKAVSLADLFARMAPPFAFEAMLGRFVLGPDPDVADVFASSRVPGVEPDGYLTGGANFFSYRDAKVDGLLAQAAVTTDAGALQKLYLQLQETFIGDPPLLVLWGDLGYHAVPKGLKGLDPGPFSVLWNIASWQPARR